MFVINGILNCAVSFLLVISSFVYSFNLPHHQGYYNFANKCWMMAGIMGSYSGIIGSYEDLPEELLVEIFVRSSVKVLLRVKSVCKSWYTLINNPCFTKKHLEYQKMMSRNNGLFLLRHYHRDNDKASYFLFDEESITNSATSSSYNVLVHPSIFASFCSGPITRIEGPVNGLYCIYNRSDRFVIWNPATSEVGFLPFPEDFLCGIVEGYEEILNFYGSIIGFGTDPSNEDDYKVIAICAYDDGCYDDDYCRILYTASTNSWRLLKDDGFVGSGEPRFYWSNNTYLNGVYYWLTRSEHDGCRYVLAFDMGKEVFYTVSTTNIIMYCSEGSNTCSDIALHKDQIGLFIVKKDKGEIDIWILMNGDIWIKEMSVDTGIRGIEKSLGFWKDDNKLLLLVIDDSRGQIGERSNSQTVVYNTKTRAIVKNNIGPRGWTNVFEVTFYHESLVSLSGDITKYKGNYSSVLEEVALFLHG